jgi:hypothetical protein
MAFLILRGAPREDTFDSGGQSEVHGRKPCLGRMSTINARNIPAVVIMPLDDIRFVRILAHVTRMFDPALTTEDDSLTSDVLHSSSNPGDPG